MNHPQAWCMETITVGCVTYDQSTAISLMRHSSSQDKTYTMFQQLVATKLNINCKGSDPSCIAAQLQAADNWMCMHPPGSGVTANSAAWQMIRSTYNALEKYNTGKSCAPSCDTAAL